MPPVPGTAQKLYRSRHPERYRLAQHRNGQNQWAKRQSALATLKLDSGCVDCGYAENPDALQFDHVRGDKVRSISQMVLSAWDKLFAELEKCEVRCANCHAIRTAERRR